jgi:hypothetical protein
MESLRPRHGYNTAECSHRQYTMAATRSARGISSLNYFVIQIIEGQGDQDSNLDSILSGILRFRLSHPTSNE